VNTVVIHGKVIKPISPKVQFPGADLWCCTHTQQQYGKFKSRIDDWDEWFEVHLVERTPFYDGVRIKRPKTLAWYRTLPANGRPLWMMDVDSTIPASKRFPIEEIEAAFPPDPGEDGQQWTCQVDYMIAFAILRGYQHIVLHGHGVRHGRTAADMEHMLAHRGILYWIGFARGRRVRVTVLEPSWYRAPAKRYAYETGGLKVRAA